MKRALILLLALALLVAFTVPAGAKWVFGSLTMNGWLFIDDRVVKNLGDCRIVNTMFQFTRLQKTRYGMVKRVIRMCKVCCHARTYQFMTYRYLGADWKPLHSAKIHSSRAKGFKPKPGTAGYSLVKKVCSPGFLKSDQRGSGPARPGAPRSLPIKPF